MANRQKLLLLDDDQKLVDSYADLLRQLPCQPEVRTCTSAPHAIALLDSESFNLLITDLKMPKMDGLQVLSIVRHKFPGTRIVVLTALLDEQYRARAFSMGADLFWQKPSTKEGIQLFQECIASLLEHRPQRGFRGVQSKSLVDLIQWECLSQTSSVLRIVQGSQEGKIWLHDGEVVDAQANGLVGEEAFREIFSWKSGHFEVLPPEPNRSRTICRPYQGLLLASAQALDEHREQGFIGTHPPPEVAPVLAPLTRHNGVEFVLTVGGDQKIESWGVENAEGLIQWTKDTLQRLRELGASLEAGELAQIQATGLRRHVAFSARGQAVLCVGFNRSMSTDQVHQVMKQITNKWAS